jgi:hypothetical protein
LLENHGFNVTHCYEDLVFIEHNAFLLRMEEQGEDVSVIFNTDSELERRGEISKALAEAGKGYGLKIVRNGTYVLTADEENSNLKIEFKDD